MSDTNTQTIWIESRPTVLGSREIRNYYLILYSVARMEMIEVEITKEYDNHHLIAEAKLNPMRGGVYPGLHY